MTESMAESESRWNQHRAWQLACDNRFSLGDLARDINDTPPVQGAPDMQLLPGEFHFAGGLTFRRAPSGHVVLREWTRSSMGLWNAGLVAVIPASSWNSIVGAVRLLGTTESGGIDG